MQHLKKLAVSLAFALAVTSSVGSLTASAQNLIAHPKVAGSNDEGFGGFITKVTPCICNDLGFLITISGMNGGDYLFSFSKPPTIQVGQFFSIGGPIIGGSGGSGKCGTSKSHGDCRNEKSGKVIKYLGGFFNFGG